MEQQKDSITIWKSQAGFIWSLIGSAVGFANILSFSREAYKNGGGAFLIPYIIALMILGIPFLILEGFIGKRYQKPLVSAYGEVWGRIGKVFGWLAVIACLTIGAFYVVLTGYSIAYIYFSGSGIIPRDTKYFFIHTFLRMSGGLTDLGTISFPVLMSTFIVIVISGFVLVRNIKDGIEKVSIIFMPMLAIIMTMFAVMASLLPHGWEGWVYYLKPDFSKLLDPLLWRDVLGQLFFSLSLGLGIVVGYSRYTSEKTNIVRAMTYVALGDFIMSFISGGAIFCAIAYLSHVQGIPFEEVLSSSSTFEIGFVIFPSILKCLGPILTPLIGMIFFFCLFIAGITGFFSIAESVAGNIESEFNFSRKKSVILSLSFLTLLALPFCMGIAPHLIDALAPMVLGFNMVISGIILITAFFGKRSRLKEDFSERKPLYFYALVGGAPIILGSILVGNVFQEIHTLDVARYVRWGWFILALLIGVGIVNKKENYYESLSE